VNAGKLETLVVNEIRERILTPKNLAGLAEQVAKEMSADSEEHTRELNAVEAEIGDVRRRLDRLYEAIESGQVLPQDLGARIHELSERHNKLELRKNELEVTITFKSVEAPTAEEVRECASELQGILGRGSLTEKRAFVRSFVREVKITGDEAKLTYVMPESPMGQPEDGDASSCIVRYGGPFGTVPELLFEKKQLNPPSQQLLLSRSSIGYLSRIPRFNKKLG
jgi:hypothetical protein